MSELLGNAKTLTSSRQDAAGGKPADDRIPGIFLLSEIHQRTINRGEHSSPHRKVSADDGSSFFDGDQAPDESAIESLRTINR